MTMRDRRRGDAPDRRPRWPPTRRRYDLSALQAIASGGAILSPSVKAQLAELLPHAQGGRHVRRVGDRRPGPTRRPAGDGGGPPVCAPTTHRRCSTTTCGPSQPGTGRVGKLGPPGPHPARLLQGPGEDGGHVPRHRRRALVDPRRHGRGRGRRHDRAARPRRGVASTPAARRCTPRRSRACSRPTRRWPTRSWSACPTSASASGSPPSSRCAPGADDPADAELEAYCQRPHLGLQGAPHLGPPRPPAAPPDRQGRLQVGRRGSLGRYRTAELPVICLGRRATDYWQFEAGLAQRWATVASAVAWTVSGRGAGKGAGEDVVDRHGEGDGDAVDADRLDVDAGELARQAAGVERAVDGLVDAGRVELVAALVDGGSPRRGRR